MIRIKVGDKTIRLDFDTEQIFLQESEDEDYPCIILQGSDADGTVYELLYHTTQSYKDMVRKMLGDRRITPRLTRLTLDLYEQLTHESYCSWLQPVYCQAI